MVSYGVERWLFVFNLFCIYGWVQESIIESLYHKKLINRGFLKGPYIPIYGFGGLTMLMICLPFRANGFLVFLVGLVSCTILEYFTGWLMETCFGMQFWDYSMLKITFRNRISLISSLFWGVLSLFMTYFLFGIVNRIVEMTPDKVIVGFDTIVMILMFVDFFFAVKHFVNVENIVNTFSLGIDHLGSHIQKPLDFIDRMRGIDNRQDDVNDRNNYNGKQ